MFLQVCEDIISSSALICADHIQNEIQKVPLLNRRPDVELVTKQCDHLICLYKKQKRLTPEMSRVIYQIYEYLIKCDRVEMFTSKQIIKTSDNQLVLPNQVYQTVDAEIPGYLFEVDPLMKSKYQNLMGLLGIKEQCFLDQYVKALSDIALYYDNDELPENLLQAIIKNVIPHLCKIKQRNEELGDIYLPDSNCIMQPMSELCYQDADWLPFDPGVKYINKDIARSYVRELNIKKLRSDRFLRSNNVIDELWSDFGQKEELTSRIKNLLKGYSEAEDVFKELLQNADDAGSTEIKFILDKRSHGTEKIFSEKWEPLQGPNLLVYNNGIFTKKDL